MASKKQSSKPTVLWNQSSGFRATGKGYYNKLPDFSAENKGNAILHNRAVVDSDPQHKMKIFCTAISTGWQVIGSYGQSISSRAFYPQHLIQLPVIIEGICANQYEYDRLVDFVQKHHETALKSTYDEDTHPLAFKLFPYQIDTGKTDSKGDKIIRTVHDKINFEGYISSIKAGHQRFVNAPTFQIEMLVAFESKQDEYHLSAEIEAEVFNDYLKSFGDSFVAAKKKQVQKVSKTDQHILDQSELNKQYKEFIGDFTDFFNDFFSDNNSLNGEGGGGGGAF